jgi:hypothetical protein
VGEETKEPRNLLQEKDDIDNDHQYGGSTRTGQTRNRLEEKVMREDLNSVASVARTVGMLSILP